MLSDEKWSQIARFMGPTWDPPGSCRPQMGPMLAPWTLLSGVIGGWYNVEYIYQSCKISFVQNLFLSSPISLKPISWYCSNCKDIIHCNSPKDPKMSLATLRTWNLICKQGWQQLSILNNSYFVKLRSTPNLIQHSILCKQSCILGYTMTFWERYIHNFKQKITNADASAIWNFCR